MTNTICAGRGGIPVPRLSEPLLSQQEVNGIKSIGTADSTVSGCNQSAQKDAQMLPIDAAQAHWHLDLLGRDERDTNIRAIPHKGLKGSAINGKFALDLEKAQRWQATGRGIYLQPNVGGTRADEISSCTTLFLEYDDRPVEDQVGIWRELNLPQPSFQVHTGGKSIHHYWVLVTPLEPQLWTVLMDRLIANAPGCDRSCKGANRMMRLAGGWYIDRNGDATAQSEIINATGDRHEAGLFDELLPELTSSEPCNRRPRKSPRTGSRSLREICGALECIPRREEGLGTYLTYRNLLWGLVDACAEAGFSAEVAIDLMEDHSPSNECGWDVRQVALSGGQQIGAGTFWWHAQQHGWGVRHA